MTSPAPTFRRISGGLPPPPTEAEPPRMVELAAGRYLRESQTLVLAGSLGFVRCAEPFAVELSEALAPILESSSSIRAARQTSIVDGRQALAAAGGRLGLVREAGPDGERAALIQPRPGASYVRVAAFELEGVAAAAALAFAGRSGRARRSHSAGSHRWALRLAQGCPARTLAGLHFTAAGVPVVIEAATLPEVILACPYIVIADAGAEQAAPEPTEDAAA